MKTTLARCGFLGLVTLLGACGDASGTGNTTTDSGVVTDTPATPTNVAGAYSATLTNANNGCMIDNWSEGNVNDNIPVTITQSGSSVSGDIGGLAGVFIEAAIGVRTFTGSVTGSTVTMNSIGTRSFSRGSCTWTYELTLNGTLTGNALNGTVVWRARTNMVPDCGSTATCTSTQNMVASRPPQP